MQGNGFDYELFKGAVFWNLEQGSGQVGDNEEEGGDGVAGLQQGDCEREQEVAGDHQEQKDPEAKKC